MTARKSAAHDQQQAFPEATATYAFTAMCPQRAFTTARARQRAALKALAHDSFYRQCRYLLSKDFITEDELENLNYLNDAYASLGLNGTGEELYRRCLEKELK